MCTFKMHYNKEETKSFNTKEKVRVMVRERKRAFVEGKQHVQVWETLQQRGERKQWLGGEKEKYLTKGRKCAHRQDVLQRKEKELQL